jgi:hypothetical protein
MIDPSSQVMSDDARRNRWMAWSESATVEASPNS